MNMLIPPIKCQGIKSKLVPKIKSLLPNVCYNRWIEPFMGSGVVAFNILPERALLCDSNPHLIAFYSALQAGAITEHSTRMYLEEAGKKLHTRGEEYYYEVRSRFNHTHDPLDFLFLNRSCFNGMMRFNGKGEFNVPFCRKPERFSPAYITKIVHQIAAVGKVLQVKNFEFICQDFKTTLSGATDTDFIYCDPPYIDRYADYFNQWGEQDEAELFRLLLQTPARFIFSTWKGNEFRENHYISKYSEYFHLETQTHYYHIGGEISNRHAMEEALLTNFSRLTPIVTPSPVQQMLSL